MICDMDIYKILRENKKRVTQERLDIFQSLQEYHVFSYQDILASFENISRASVFRTLKTFEEL